MTLRRYLCTLTAFAAVALSAQPAPAQQIMSMVESPIIGWTNSIRHQHGRRDVTANAKLNRAAQAHALHMAARETMSHSLDGLTLVDRVNRAGYAYAVIAENVAFNHGYDNPVWTIFDSWLKSPGHFGNIMNPDFTEIGVGFARSASGRVYACQIFGRPANAHVPMMMVPVYPLPYSPYTNTYRGYHPLRQTSMFRMGWE